jgi:hypothetical protein
MYVGDTKTFAIAVTQDGAPVNVSGWSFAFSAAVSLTASDPPPLGFVVANASFTITNGASGLVTMTIPKTATSGLNLTKSTAFYYALVGTETGGAVHTLASGSLALMLGADDVL